MTRLGPDAWPQTTIQKLLKAKFHYEAGRRQVRSQIPLRYMV